MYILIAWKYKTASFNAKIIHCVRWRRSDSPYHDFARSVYIHAIVRSFGPLLDTSAIRGENMKHSDYKKGTSPTTGVARPVYTTVRRID